MNQPISDVMTRENLITVPVGTTLDGAREILHQHKVEKLLVVDRDFRLKGLITVKDIQKQINYPNACKDNARPSPLRRRHRRGARTPSIGRPRWSAATWTSWSSTRRTATRRAFSTSCAKIRQRFPEIDLIAGNVATAEATEALIALGRQRGEGRDWRRIDLHDARDRGHRRADDHGDHGLRPRRRRRTTCRLSPTAASGSPATSRRRSPSGASSHDDRQPVRRHRREPRRN